VVIVVHPLGLAEKKTAAARFPAAGWGYTDPKMLPDPKRTWAPERTSWFFAGPRRGVTHCRRFLCQTTHHDKGARVAPDLIAAAARVGKRGRR